jgi:hypothetical protein
MLFCDNCNGGYHLFCLKPEFIQIPASIWYYSSCSSAAPWFLLRPCHTFLDSGLGGDTGDFHLSLFLCIVYICACISFWLISFYLWLVLVFLFSRVYYGFKPLWHWTSQHYTSRHPTFYPFSVFGDLDVNALNWHCSKINLIISIYVYQ